MSLTPLPTLDELAAHPELAQDLPPSVALDLLTRLACLQPILLARALSPANGGESSPPDQLLTAEHAAARLGVSLDSLYRKRWPFEVRPTPGTRRFSTKGIERYIRQRQGR